MVGGVPWQIKGSGGRRLIASASSQPYLMFLIVGPLHENCCFDLNQKTSFFSIPPCVKSSGTLSSLFCY